MKATGFTSVELRAIAGDPQRVRNARADAANGLLLVGDRRGVVALLKEFYEVGTRVEIYEIGMAISWLKDPMVVGPMIRALEDASWDRREVAAATLSRLSCGKVRRRCRALREVLADLTQSSAVRVEAAEGLGILGCRKGIPELIAASRDADVSVRFWSVFSLGGFVDDSCEGERVVRALEAALEDQEDPGHGWWPISLEALAMLGSSNVEPYRTRMSEELERRSNEGWACFYG